MKPEYTQDQAIAFECAREAITDLMAIYTMRIEDAKNSGDRVLATGLTGDRSGLAQERANLHVHDADTIATVRKIYGRRIRAWREQGEE